MNSPFTDTRFSPGRILVVDDESLNRQVLGKILEGQGYQVTFAVDGLQALEQVAAAPPDVILLDVMMPRMDGFEVCRRLKADPATMPIPILIVTALDARADRVKGVSAGADDFLSKPIDPEELALRVRNAVYRKQLYDELASKYAELKAMKELRESLTSLIDADTEALSSMMRREASGERATPGEADKPKTSHEEGTGHGPN
jgi:CheY-like chemotaxis protein